MPVSIPRADTARHSIFIASSVEGLPIARQFREELIREANATLWCDIFTPGKFTLETLESALGTHSHALVVLSPDDITSSRGVEEVSARDNAIFESGLFIGRYGHGSTFIAIPDRPRIRLPSDLWGLTAVEYKVREGAAEPSYQTTEAVKGIISALGKATVKSGRRAYERPSAFWDVMGDTILILYGVESETARAHPRYRVSLRDLETSLEIKTFLDRHYPRKRVLLLPSTAAGWGHQYSNADLVIVGGFVTNSEFAQHRVRYESLFRLRMGRLCIVDGQRVNIPRFQMPNGQRPPAMGDSRGIEDVPTEFTTRDFGFIFSGILPMYGHERRVVAVAGVKGHGTRGAAAYLCRERHGLDAELKLPLRHDDTLEAAVAVDVVRDLVDTVRPIRVRRNDEVIVDLSAADSVGCELLHPCEGCEFGLPQVMPRKPSKLVPSRIKAIVFDLDDTLIDTFGLLITALEVRAAKEMLDAGTKGRDEVALARALLHVRRTTPSDVRAGLRRSGVRCSPAAFAKRKTMLDAVPLDHLVLSPDVAHLLRSLRNHFALYLLTSGLADFQNAKIDKLGIRSYFAGVTIVSNGSHRVKGRALESLASNRGFVHDSVLVVGNRLDQEIAAANVLGMPSVWVKHGEGCEMVPTRGRGEPDFVIDSVEQLPSLFWE